MESKLITKWKPILETLYGDKKISDKTIKLISEYSEHHSVLDDIKFRTTDEKASFLPVSLHVFKKLNIDDINIDIMEAPMKGYKTFGGELKNIQVATIQIAIDIDKEEVMMTPNPELQYEHLLIEELSNRLNELIKENKQMFIYQLVSDIKFNEKFLKVIIESRVAFI